MKNSLICLLTTIVILFSFLLISPCYAQNGSIKIIINDNELTFIDVEPFINENNRTMVPIRVISENLGADVEWNGDNKMVTITAINKAKIYIKLNEYMYWIDDDFPLGMDTKAIMIDDRVFVPLRFVSEALGADITWDGESRTVNIQFSNNNDKLIEKKIINGNDAAITRVPVDSLEIRTDRTLESAILTGISCTKDAFVVVGEKGIIKFSYDGYNWRQGNSQISDKLSCIANNGTVFVAVGDNNCILSSSDLINWKKAELNFDESCDFYSVIYDGIRFVAVGNSKAAWSYDGINWEENNCKLAKIYSNYDGCFLAYNGNAYVLFIPDQGRRSCFISYNLEDWESINVPFGNGGIDSLYYDGENFIMKTHYYYSAGRKPSGMEIRGTDYTYFQSSNGINWITAPAGKENPPFTDGVSGYYSPFKTAYNGDIYVNAGGGLESFSDAIKVSKDNENWEHTFGSSGQTGYYLYNFFYEKDRFITSIGNQNESYISSDGYSWKQVETDWGIFQTEDLQDNVIQYPRNYRLTMSKDILLHMEYKYDTVSFYIGGILKVDDYYLAYGDIDTVGEYANSDKISAILKFDSNCNYSVVFNALDWGMTKTTNSSIQSLACDGDSFVASFYHQNNKKYIATSYDLNNWIVRQDDERTTSIIGVEGKFIKISDNFIFASNDGIDFNEVFRSKDSFNRLYWDGNKILACSYSFDNYNRISSSTIFYSYDGLNWEILFDDISGEVSDISWNDDIYILTLDDGKFAIISQK